MSLACIAGETHAAWLRSQAAVLRRHSAVFLQQMRGVSPRICAQEAHTNGIACVIACAQEEAEGYCEGLRGNGLISSIEPDGSGSGGSSD